MDSTVPRVLGVLAGDDMPDAQIRAWVESAEIVLAADGAGDRLLRFGTTAHTTIGDMDSTSSVLPLRRIIRDPDQSTSDCDKLLDLAGRMGYTEITLAGAEGDRLDHVLGTLASAVRSPLNVRIALRKGLVWLLRGPAEMTFDTSAGEVVSLMPIERCEGVTLTGVKWPLEGAEIASTSLVSLSNESIGEAVSVSFAAGAAALFHLAPRLEAPSWP